MRAPCGLVRMKYNLSSRTSLNRNYANLLTMLFSSRNGRIYRKTRNPIRQETLCEMSIERSRGVAGGTIECG